MVEILALLGSLLRAGYCGYWTKGQYRLLVARRIVEGSMERIGLRADAPRERCFHVVPVGTHGSRCAPGNRGSSEWADGHGLAVPLAVPVAAGPHHLGRRGGR